MFCSESAGRQNNIQYSRGETQSNPWGWQHLPHASCAAEVSWRRYRPLSVRPHLTVLSVTCLPSLFLVSFHPVFALCLRTKARKCINSSLWLNPILPLPPPPQCSQRESDVMKYEPCFWAPVCIRLSCIPGRAKREKMTKHFNSHQGLNGGKINSLNDAAVLFT